jgi:hypothetical protein
MEQSNIRWGEVIGALNHWLFDGVGRQPLGADLAGADRKF